MEFKKIMDQYNGDPVHATLYSLAKDRPLVKEALKTAQFNKTAADSLPDTAFAWKDERRFPIHTKEDTLASMLYREKVANVPSDVDDRLQTAARIYGIDKQLLTKQSALPDIRQVEYALSDKKQLPLGTVEQIKTAEQTLCREFTKLSLVTRADAFQKLAKAASKHRVELQPLTNKLAGLTVSNTAMLREWLEVRAAATTGPVSTAFSKLASGLKTASREISDRKDQVKLATTISDLDIKGGLEKFYDRKLPDPLLTVFNTDKLAEESCDLGGAMVPCSVLMQLPPEVWSQLGVPELAEIAQAGDTVQFKQVMTTLPMDIKMTLAGQLSGQR